MTRRPMTLPLHAQHMTHTPRARARREETVTTETEKVLQDIAAERARQDAQWGGPQHDDGLPAGEWRWFREKFERRAVAVLGMPVDRRRDALVKIAALAVAQIEAMDRSVQPTTPEPR